MGVSLSSAGDSEDPDLVPYEIAWPKPLWVGVGPKVDAGEWPHLPPDRLPRWPTIRAPKGAVNPALDAEVTSSVEPIDGSELEWITDGERTGERDTLAILPAGLQWVQVDLGEARRIHGVVIWHHFHKWGLYHDVIVQLSNDPEFREGVITLFNNDHDATAGLPVGAGRDPAYLEWNHGLVIALEEARRARYLRTYAGGDAFDGRNFFSEIVVVGVPADE